MRLILLIEKDSFAFLAFFGSSNTWIISLRILSLHFLILGLSFQASDGDPAERFYTEITNFSLISYKVRGSIITSPIFYKLTKTAIPRFPIFHKSVHVIGNIHQHQMLLHSHTSQHVITIALHLLLDITYSLII